MKLYRNIIVLVIIIAVLGVGAYLATNFVPDEKNVEPSETKMPETTEMFSVFKVDSEKIIRLNIKNSKEEYHIEQKDGNWILNDDYSININQTSAKTLAHTCSSVSVKQVVSETDENAKAFGFDENSYYVELVFNDGKKQKILVGNKTLDNENYYIKLENEPQIYLKNSYGTESIIPFMESLRDLSIMSVDTSNYGNIKSVEIVKKDSLPVCIVNTVKDSKEEIPYAFKMTKPVDANISGEFFSDKIVNAIKLLEADAVIEDHAKNMSVYGLSDPYAEFKLVTEDNSYILKIGKETDSYRFVTLNDSDTVYAVEKSKLEFADISYIDLMSSIIHVEYVDAVDKVEVSYKNTNYIIQIKGEGNDRAYTINGKKINYEDGVLVYRAIIGIGLDSVCLSDIPDNLPEAHIKYYKKDGTTPTVEFIPINERNYRVLVNKKGNSITAKKNFKDVIDVIENALNNTK